MWNPPRLRHRGSSSKADLRIETNKRESKEETCLDDLVINYRSVSAPSLENYLLCPPPLHAKSGSSELRCKSFFKVVNQCSSMCSGGILKGNNNHLLKYERPYFVI